MPKPTPRPRRIDVVFAQRPPVPQIALAVCGHDGGPFRYHAVAEDRAWSGQLDAPNKETAILDAIGAILTDAPELDRVRFLVSLQAKSRLWRCTHEIAALFPGVSVEWPGVSGLRLMEAAKAGLATLHSADGPPQRSAESPPRPTDMSPLWVATDGSVRRKFSGFGWLASNGQCGLHGYRHSKRLDGTKIVLISELRAIFDAVRNLQQPLILMSDSKLAIEMVKMWMDGEDVLPRGYKTERSGGTPAVLVSAQRLIYSQRERVTAVWVRGHQGEPLNEGADALARLAQRRAADPVDLAMPEYHRRAKGLAEAFAKEFSRVRSVGQAPLVA